ncbi:MAG: AMP-binding protein, partial [Acidobacteria bacterium]|nr:AMP-binding protein [Acidobacteriota bacterium]
WSDVPAGRSLFDSFLVFQNEALDPTRVEMPEELLAGGAGSPPRDEGSFEHIAGADERSHYVFDLVAYPGPELGLELRFDRGRQDLTTVARMLRHLEGLLEGLASGIGGRLEAVPLLSPAERHKLVTEWTPRREPLAIHGTLVEAFAAHVARTPAAPALTDEAGTLAYGELDALANRLAHALIERGVGPEVTVGLCLARSRWTVVGILGILKAG